MSLAAGSAARWWPKGVTRSGPAEGSGTRQIVRQAPRPGKPPPRPVPPDQRKASLPFQSLHSDPTEKPLGRECPPSGSAGFQPASTFRNQEPKTWTGGHFAHRSTSRIARLAPIPIA